MFDDDSLIIPEVWNPENIPIIQPNSYFVLGVNDDTTTNGGIHVDLVFDRNDFMLANSADEFVLRYTNGDEVDREEYDNGTSFPDPNGKSME